MEQTGRRIGIFGGSFDPIHFGHLILAESCRETLGLDHVLLIPTATSPLKPSGPIASNVARLEMLSLAIAGTPGLVAEPLELERGGISYTIDSIGALQAREPEAEYWLLVGADSVASLDQWKEPAEILRRVKLGVVARGGFPQIDFSVPRRLLGESQSAHFSPRVVPMPILEISSREIRRRVAAGQSIRFRTPRVVEDLIHACGLYQQQ